MVGQERRLVLGEILNKKQIHYILTRFIGEDVPYNLEGSEIKPAVDGIAGFLADHIRAVLHVDVKDEKKKVHLFLKCVPTINEAKAKFVKEYQFFVREHFMYKLIEEICADVNAIFVDFQSIRYAPPAFDLVIFLYLTTDKSFREEREEDVFDYYYSVFVKNLSVESKKRLEDLGYDKDNFFSWCKKARMMAMVVAMGIYPYALMDAKTDEEVFDNSDKYMKEDRSEPVLAHANKCEAYKQRNLAINEEFVEKYVLKQV